MLWSDLRNAVRALRHAAGYAGWVVGSPAIGMAVTVAALALLNAVMVLPFPEVTDQARLVRVNVVANCGRPDCWSPMSSEADYAALQQGLHRSHRVWRRDGPVRFGDAAGQRHSSGTRVPSRSRREFERRVTINRPILRERDDSTPDPSAVRRQSTPCSSRRLPRS
jgi:hypothetical protein